MEENATRALMIAAAIIMVVLVLSLLAVFWSKMAGYFTATHDEKMLQQAIEFNNKFANYAGKELRGNELVSIMNRIVDYNNYQSDMVGYERIIIDINLDGKNSQFRYGYEPSSTNAVIPKNGNINNNDNDVAIKNLSTTSSRLAYEDFATIIPNLTDTKLQKMSAGSETIVNDDNPNFLSGLTSVEKTQKLNDYNNNRAKFLTKTLGYEVDKNNTTFINNVKNATYQYYQYTMFKRAMFECTGVEYNQSTGRVNRMTFKVIVKNNGEVKFD